MVRIPVWNAGGPNSIPGQDRCVIYGAKTCLSTQGMCSPSDSEITSVCFNLGCQRTTDDDKCDHPQCQYRNVGLAIMF